MKRIGLTGGIGSGKSTLVAMFAELGVPVLDLDALGRELHKDADCRAALVAAFGNGILGSSGAVDRAALGRLCFADAEKMKKLNKIMHPRIWQREEAWLAAQQAPYVLIEASVLIESAGAARMDAVVVVLADIETRRDRVLRQRDMPAGQFDAILARQCDDVARRKVADFIVENEADLDALQRAAVDIHHQLLLRAQ